MLVEIDGEFRFGGVDDVYEQMEQGGEDADEEEDLFEIHPSRLTKRHRFFGTVEVKSRNVLSERGCSLLENAGADLNALDEGGVIYIVIRGIFHRYETSSFTQDNGTWITSVSGTNDNPWYLSYRVASHHRATYKRCRITRERFWWLEFVRHCCDKIAKGKRSTDKRTITWLVRCYMEMFPHHQSGVHPISDGPPKNTQAPEVRLALARNADFIHKKLKTANPRPMNINEWTKLKLTYKKSLPSLEPVYDGASESEEGSASGNEGEEDEVMDIEPSVRTPSRHIASSLRGRSRDFSRDMSLFGPPLDENIEELEVALDAVQLPRDTTKKMTIRHRPTLSASFQYHCPFNSPVAEQSEASSHQCTFKIDLIRLTQQQISSLPQELRGLVETSKTKLGNPTLSALLAALLDPHITQHLKRQSGINQVFGLYEVEVPVHPAAAHLLAQSAGIHRRFDRQSNLVRYRWIVEPGSGYDEGPRAPGEGPTQPPGPAPAQGQAGPSAAPAPPPQQQGPLFTSEVKEMFYYIRGAALKAAEIVRYQTDMKQLQRVNGQVAPVPNRLLGAFRQDTERLDQVCDVMEAKILRLISVLVREINRQKAKAAEEAAAKAALEREQAAAAAAAAAASMASSTEAVKTETVKTEDMDLDTQPDGGQPSDTEKLPTTSEPNSSLAPPRVSSTAPSVVSLSNLPSSADLSEAAATDQATKARLARNFSLKLDLSSPNLRGSFTGLVPNTAAPDPPGSPVRIAPKSAKPRTDDPTATAFGLMGPPQFNPALMQQLAAQQPPSAFVQNNSMPFSGVADPSDTNALIPDILSSVTAAAQQASTSATQPDASLQAFSAGDVIDLTGNSPIRGQVNMPINVDADGSAETIDLTMDSPTIPLSQLKRVEGGVGNEEGGSMTGIEVPAVTEGGAKVENTTTEAQQVNGTSAGPAPDASLEGLVSSLTGAGGEAQPTNGDVTTAATAGLPTDATSLLATLTAAAQTSSNDNATNGAGASNDANANMFQGLIPPGDFGDLSSIGMGGGDMGMDLSAMGVDMSMYLPSADGASGAGLGDAATAGMFEGFGGLMGDGGAGGAGASMDFDNMLGDMGIFAGMGGTAGDGSNTQNN